MKIQSLSIIMFSVLIAFMVTACEIKIMPPTNWGDQKPTEGDPVSLEAQVSLDKIAVGVVKDGWETIAVTAMDERGEPDNNWTVRSVNETIATVQRTKKQITSAHQSACCPTNKICICYTNSEDIDLALIAIRKAYNFFINIGYSETYFLEVVFQKKVVVECPSGHLIRVIGKLGKDNHIYLTKWDEPWLKEKNGYGLEMRKEFYESLIVHEVAHFIVEKITGGKIECTHSEYVAYVVQLSQMKPQMRQAILNQRFLPAFKTHEINLEIMLLDPVAFAVKSYLHFKENKKQFLKEILSNVTF